MDPEKRHSVAPHSTSGPCAGLRPYAIRKHFAIYVDVSCRLVLVQRRPAPFDSSEELIASFDHVQHTLRHINRERYRFLGDTRRGPARNDPRYEDDMKRVRHKLLGGYDRAATLTQTVAGQLQIRRYAQQDGREILVTSEPQAAFGYLGIAEHALPELRDDPGSDTLSLDD